MQTVITNGRLKSIRLTNVERRRISETKILLGTLNGMLPDLVPSKLVEDVASVLYCLEKADGKLVIDDSQMKLPFEKDESEDESEPAGAKEVTAKGR